MIKFNDYRKRRGGLEFFIDPAPFPLGGARARRNIDQQTL